MIPRYSPSYNFKDLIVSLAQAAGNSPLSILQRKLSKMYGVKHVFLFNKARTALYVLLKAYNRPGEVILPAYNCIAVPEAILYAGYFPKFVDIELNSFNMRIDAVRNSITPTTTVILATHQFGIPCNIEEMVELRQKKEILLVEDAAAALGATYNNRLVGTFGDATILSFDSRKVLSGGTGGALLVKDDFLANKVHNFVMSLRSIDSSLFLFGKCFAQKILTTPSIYKFVYSVYKLLYGEDMFKIIKPRKDMPAHFLRLCSKFAAALTLNELAKVHLNLKIRKTIAQIYSNNLADHSQIKIPKILNKSAPSWIMFPIRIERKYDFYKWMQSKGVDVSWNFRYVCTDSFLQEEFPNAKKAVHTVLGLPVYPSLSTQSTHYISKIAQSFK